MTATEVHGPERVLGISMVYDGGRSARVRTTHRSATIRITDGRLISADPNPAPDDGWELVHAGGDTSGHADFHAPPALLAQVRNMLDNLGEA